METLVTSEALWERKSIDSLKKNIPRLLGRPSLRDLPDDKDILLPNEPVIPSFQFAFDIMHAWKPNEEKPDFRNYQNLAPGIGEGEGATAHGEQPGTPLFFTSEDIREILVDTLGMRPGFFDAEGLLSITKAEILNYLMTRQPKHFLLNQTWTQTTWSKRRFSREFSIAIQTNPHASHEHIVTQAALKRKKQQRKITKHREPEKAVAFFLADAKDKPYHLLSKGHSVAYWLDRMLSETFPCVERRFISYGEDGSREAQTLGALFQSTKELYFRITPGLAHVASILETNPHYKNMPVFLFDFSLGSDFEEDIIPAKVILETQILPRVTLYGYTQLAETTKRYGYTNEIIALQQSTKNYPNSKATIAHAELREKYATGDVFNAVCTISGIQQEPWESAL